MHEACSRARTFVCEDQFVVDRYTDHSLQGLDQAYRRDDMYQQRAELAERYFAYITGAA